MRVTSTPGDASHVLANAAIKPGNHTRQVAGNQRAGHHFPRSGERGYPNISLSRCNRYFFTTVKGTVYWVFSHISLILPPMPSFSMAIVN